MRDKIRKINRDLEYICQNITEAIVAMSWLEIIAVIFGLLSVWYAKKENILVFPTGIISVLIYVYICFQFKLYADMAINGYYFIMSIYGWILWSSKRDNTLIPISQNTYKENSLFAGLFVLLFFVMQLVLKTYTDSDVPYWDSLTSALFLLAMILMARKKIEHWLFWISGDLISIPLYAYKGLYLTSFQYLVFLGIAIAGYIEWHKKTHN